jgi:hypothetical protein
MAYKELRGKIEGIRSVATLGCHPMNPNQHDQPPIRTGRIDRRGTFR